MTNNQEITNFIYHLLMIHNLSSETFYTINPSFWSIALEFQLYLSYPIILPLIRRFGIRPVYGLTLVIAVIVLCAGQLGIEGCSGPAFHKSLPAYGFMWYSGVFLAERFRNGGRLVPLRYNPFLISIVLFLAMALSQWTVQTAFLAKPLAAFGWLILFDWWLHVPLRGKAETSWAFKTMAVVGSCSYSLYLIHQPFLRPLLSSFGHYSDPWVATTLKVSATFAVLLMVSYAMYHFIERPSIAMGAWSRAKWRNRRIANGG